MVRLLLLKWTPWFHARCIHIKLIQNIILRKPLLFMVDVHGGCSWWMFMVDVHGGCSWWMFMVDVYDRCSWQMFMVDVHSKILFELSMTLKCVIFVNIYFFASKVYTQMCHFHKLCHFCMHLFHTCHSGLWLHWMCLHIGRSCVASLNVPSCWEIMCGFIECSFMLGDHVWLHWMCLHIGRSCVALLDVPSYWEIMCGFIECAFILGDHVWLHWMCLHIGRSCVASLDVPSYWEITSKAQLCIEKGAFFNESQLGGTKLYRGSYTGAVIQVSLTGWVISLFDPLRSIGQYDVNLCLKQETCTPGSLWLYIVPMQYDHDQFVNSEMT